jgi:hypothetical protein
LGFSVSGLTDPLTVHAGGVTRFHARQQSAAGLAADFTKNILDSLTVVAVYLIT